MTRIVLVSAVTLALAACGGGSKSGALPVVASSNVYGDIVSQIGGSHVSVKSILTDPSADPHLFEPGTANGLAVSKARVVVQNGLGYDDFMTKLENAAPSSKRHVLVVADAIPHTSNPHLWYDVPAMPRVAAAIARELAAADPKHAADYRAGERRFAASLAPVIAAIHALPAGAPVAYTEPVPGYLAEAARLRNLAPDSFTRQIEEGNEPSAGAVSEMNALITQHRIKVLLYNQQAVSPITSRLRKLALREKIAVVPITETLPPHLDYQQWQLGQIDALKRALAR
ncbi:MAG: metal ABC transporter solute-binding protein, Zn/Mn family [Gaiellaceae bacterium]